MFFLLPVGVDYRAQRYPVVTFTLMGINTVIYLISLVYYLSAGEVADKYFIEHFWLIPAAGVWYTYFTSLFVHADLFHWLGNMVYLFLFGSCVEDTIGRWWYILFYFVGGLVSNFAHIAASPEHFADTIPLGGASGAISACIGGFVLFFLKTKINFRYFIFLFFRFWSGEFWLPAWLVISFWFLKDLGSAILTAAQETSGGGVAFAAHIGGMLSGLAMIGGYKIMARMKGEEPVEEEVIAAGPIRVQVPRKPAPNQPPTIYLFENEAQSGPFTAQQVKEMVALGSISEVAYYWEDGMAEWRSVAEIQDHM